MNLLLYSSRASQSALMGRLLRPSCSDLHEAGRGWVCKRIYAARSNASWLPSAQHGSEDPQSVVLHMSLTVIMWHHM